MATKGNLKSVRLSDDLIELIERQVGDTFTAKLENLVTRCVWELPARERQLEDINQQIYEKRQQLGRLSKKAESYSLMLHQMEHHMNILSNSIAQAQEHEV